MLRLEGDLVPLLLAALRRRARAASRCAGATRRRSPSSWRPTAIRAPVETGSGIRGLAEAEALADVRGLPRRDARGRRPPRRRRRPRARRHALGRRPSREAQARAYAAVDRIDWPGGLLPPRHRLAGGGAGAGRVDRRPARPRFGCQAAGSTSWCDLLRKTSLAGKKPCPIRPCGDCSSWHRPSSC